MDIRSFQPPAREPMALAASIRERFLTDGRIMDGVEPTPMSGSMHAMCEDTYDMAWSQLATQDLSPQDLDHRAGHVHIQDKLVDTEATFSGDSMHGQISETHVRHDDNNKVLFVDQRELRAGDGGFDYLSVLTRNDGSVEALATHLDRWNPANSTQQVWYLKA